MIQVGEALLFGTVQGLSEFLPISSSGHLVILHSITQFSTGDDLAFDVALHLGTLLALVAFFWRDIWQLASAWLSALVKRPHDGDRARLAWLIIFGSIPAALVGAAFESTIADVFRNPSLVALMLMIGGAALWIADRWSRSDRPLSSLRWPQALLIGCGQALALVPGISRSGITIIFGRWFRLNRSDAARFSFLLAIPITAGAGLVKMKDMKFGALSSDTRVEFLLGMAAAAIVGYLAINFLLRFVSRHSYTPFVIFRFVVALSFLTYTWLK